MSHRFIRVEMDDGSRWFFNIDQIVKVRVSGVPGKVSVEVATGKSYALDRDASRIFLAEFQAAIGASTDGETPPAT